jgi:DNA replication protein DnaC
VSECNLAKCHERAATLVTSNLDFSEWGDAFPNRLLGAATIDRLRHNAYRLVLDGKSYRSPKNYPQSTHTTSEKRAKIDE